MVTTTQPPACGKISDNVLDIWCEAQTPQNATFRSMARELRSYRRLSLRHPAPVADERTAFEKDADRWRIDLWTRDAALSAQPSGALERESVGNAAGQKLSAKWFEDFHLVFEDGEVDDWPEVARKLLGHIEACKIDEAQLESATEEIERLQAKLSAPPPERAPGGDALVSNVPRYDMGPNGDGWVRGIDHDAAMALHAPPPSSSPSATADATSSVTIATLRAALEKVTAERDELLVSLGKQILARARVAAAHMERLDECPTCHENPSFQEIIDGGPCLTCAALAGNEGKKL